MVLFDNHNHSQFSFDGQRTSIEASARSAASLQLGGICFTDHYDIILPSIKLTHGVSVPETFDIEAQQAEIDRVRSMFPEIKILKGIEIGMHADCHGGIRAVLNGHAFDQIVASVHYLEDSDPYYGGYFDDKDWKQAYGEYLETIFREMSWLKDFDIMGHYDYVARYAPYPQSTIFYKDFSDILDEIFRYLIHEGKALEINTKSYQDHGGRIQLLDENLLLRYRDMGGEIISFGSDSHDADKVGLDFPYFAAFAKSLGFRWSAHYEKRQLVQLPL